MPGVNGFSCLREWCHHLISFTKAILSKGLLSSCSKTGLAELGEFFWCHFLLWLTSVYLWLFWFSYWEADEYSVTSPVRSLAYSSMCHFALKQCTEMSLRGLQTLSVATAVELRGSPCGAAFVCVQCCLAAWVLRRFPQRWSFSICCPTFAGRGTDRVGRRPPGFLGIHLSFRFAWHWLTNGLIFFLGLVKESCQLPSSSQRTLLGVKSCWFGSCLLIVPCVINTRRRLVAVLVFLLEDSWIWWWRG